MNITDEVSQREFRQAFWRKFGWLLFDSLMHESRRRTNFYMEYVSLMMFGD